MMNRRTDFALKHQYPLRPLFTAYQYRKENKLEAQWGVFSIKFL